MKKRWWNQKTKVVNESEPSSKKLDYDDAMGFIVIGNIIAILFFYGSPGYGAVPELSLIESQRVMFVPAIIGLLCHSGFAFGDQPEEQIAELYQSILGVSVSFMIWLLLTHIFYFSNLSTLFNELNWN